MLSPMKILRMTLGITQTEVANRLGVSQPLISFYENQKRPVPQNTAIRIAKILNVEPEALHLKHGREKPMSFRDDSNF